MIRHAAQGQPWLFREIDHYLNSGNPPQKPTMREVRDTMLKHLQNLYEHYGEATGVRVARKHIDWYLKQTPNAIAFRDKINQVADTRQQYRLVSQYFEEHTTA